MVDRSSLVVAVVWMSLFAGCIEGGDIRADSGGESPVGPVAGDPTVFMDDPERDNGDETCSAATDLVSFAAKWGDSGVELEYHWRDLSVVTSPDALAEDAAGRCFYSRTDFSAAMMSKNLTETVYMDHNTNPAYSTGWRFFLEENRTDLVGQVEENTIRVTIPFEFLGDPQHGDKIGQFWVRTNGYVVLANGIFYGAHVDWAPDGQGPCDCWATYAS